MRKFFVGVLLLATLASCGSDISNRDVKKTYQGRTLHCVEDNATGGISGCDYTRFYAENPDLLPPK